MRVQVAMDDPLVMRCRDRRQDWKRDVDDLVERQRAKAPQVPGEILPVEVLHDQEGLAALHADVGDVDGVRMTDARRELRLQQETRARLRDRRERRADRLDCDALADLDVQAFVDRAHSPFAQEANDAVLAQGHPRLERPPGRPLHASPKILHILVKAKVGYLRGQTGRGSWIRSRRAAARMAEALLLERQASSGRSACMCSASSA